MNEQKTASLTMLEIERKLSASPSEVFAALTQPATMSRWFYGMETGSAKIEQDFQVGGKYTIHMLAAEGTTSKGCGKAEHAPHGEYLEIVPDKRLVFTWTSEGFVDDSVVTIELTPDGNETHLVLRHELPEDLVEPHRQGWTTCLGHLLTLF